MNLARIEFLERNYECKKLIAKFGGENGKQEMFVWDFSFLYGIVDFHGRFSVFPPGG